MYACLFCVFFDSMDAYTFFLRLVIPDVCFKKNINASRPFEHPTQLDVQNGWEENTHTHTGGEMSKRLEVGS